LVADILISNWVSTSEKIQINSQKNQIFGRKKSVEDEFTLGPMAHATLVYHEPKHGYLCGQLKDSQFGLF